MFYVQERLQPQRKFVLFCGTQGPSKFKYIEDACLLQEARKETGEGHFEIVCSVTWPLNVARQVTLF